MPDGKVPLLEPRPISTNLPRAGKPQEWPSLSDERKAMVVPKAEADLQTAYHKLREFAGSDRGNQGHG